MKILVLTKVTRYLNLKLVDGSFVYKSGGSSAPTYVSALLLGCVVSHLTVSRAWCRLLQR